MWSLNNFLLLIFQEWVVYLFYKPSINFLWKPCSNAQYSSFAEYSDLVNIFSRWRIISPMVDQLVQSRDPPPPPESFMIFYQCLNITFSFICILTHVPPYFQSIKYSFKIIWEATSLWIYLMKILEYIIFF